MAGLSGNTCEIVTLLPLGVTCNVTDATTPQSANGSIFLNITGGSAPYTVTWDNGGQGQSLINLKTGDYSATVVDYYGDYTATTTCNVGYNTFYLDKFENCQTSGNFLYYKAQQPSIFTAGKVYSLNGRSGCWTSSGTTLWTGETYVDEFAVINDGPFDNCVSCLPTPPPEPVYPEFICLGLNSSPYTQYTFQSGSTIYDGYPVWEETGSTGYKMVYFTSGGVWVMSGWTGGGVLQTTPKSGPPPTGLWLVLGSSATWTAVSGTCGVTPILDFTFKLSNPSCQNSSDGQIIITPVGGISPYTYSLDGLTYVNSSTFNNLNAGSGTIYVKDAAGTVKTKTYTLVNQTTVTNYTITSSLSQGSTTPAINSNGTLLYQYGLNIEVSPQLSNTQDITMKLNVTYAQRIASTNQSGVLDPVLNSGVTINGVSNVSISGPTIGSVVNYTTGTQTCTNAPGSTTNQPYTAFSQTYTYDVTFTGGYGSIQLSVKNGSTTYSVYDGYCPEKVTTNISVTASNVSLVNNSLCETIPGYKQLQTFKTTNTGKQTPT